MDTLKYRRCLSSYFYFAVVATLICSLLVYQAKPPKRLVHYTYKMKDYLGKKEEAFVFESTLEELAEQYIQQRRAKVEHDLRNYTLHKNLGSRKVRDLIPAEGGNPLRSFVVTTWRSGSTFIGDLIQSTPATFYHYEPLLPFGINRIRGGAEAKEAVRYLRNLFKCDYRNMKEYIEFGFNHNFLWLHTEPLWSACSRFQQLCVDPKFLQSICSFHPFQIIKTVRLNLSVMEELMKDESSNLRVILLVRDPRGTWQSRQHRDWCPGQPDCEDPALLCKDLVDDYKTAREMSHKYTDSFRVLRYEDLSFDIYNMSANVLDFLQLNYDENTETFLDSHTKADIGGVSSTFRESKTAPIHWKQDLSWDEVDHIQSSCKEALELWGYVLAKDSISLTTLNPVGKLDFPKVNLS